VTRRNDLDLGADEDGVFTGRLPLAERRRRRGWIVWIVVVIVAGAAGGAWYVFRPEIRLPWTEETRKVSFDAGPVKVMRSRPGGGSREAEAIRALRNALIASPPPQAKGLTSECLAVMSHGARGGAYILSALDSCHGIRLGKWRVDAKTHAVTPAR
jgi:hypothetical protein